MSSKIVTYFYLEQSDDNNKEVFRVSYKVFDFSRQFGKLAPEGTAQVQTFIAS
jgi:hypothetical protein